MEVGQQVQALAGLHDLGPEQGAFGQIERLQETGLAVREVLLRDGRQLHFRFRLAGNQHHLAFPHFEMGVQGGMATDHLQEGFPDRFRLQGARQRPAHGQVIDGLARRLHALEVKAFLLEGERLRGDPVRTAFRPPDGLPGEQGGQDLVLDALQGRRLDKRVHVHRDAVFLVQLDGQAEG